MNSVFNKDTGNGIYVFNKDEVFEALATWCLPRGILLVKEDVTFFDATPTVDGNKQGFIVELGFNHNLKKGS